LATAYGTAADGIYIMSSYDGKSVIEIKSKHTARMDFSRYFQSKTSLLLADL
jgi:hypothetical protein